MKKTLWVLLICLLMLSGCAAEEPQETTAPMPVEVTVPYEAPAQTLRYEGVELTMQSMWLPEAPEARVLTEAAALFEAQTGAVVMVLWPGSGEAKADILQLSAADFEAAPMDFALDLTEMAEAADYGAKSHAALRQQITDRCGYLGAIAQVPYLGGIYYNADLFASCGIETVPATWEEFLDLCALLREQGCQSLTMDREGALAAMELHLRRSIGTYEIRCLMAKGNRWDTDLAAIAALEQVMNFAREGNMASGTPAEMPNGRNKMALTDCAMMVGTNADCDAVEADTLMDISWGMFPYPGAQGSGTWMYADMLVVHADCAAPQAAFDFVLLLATGEFDQLRADIARGVPADPANASYILGAMEAIEAAQPEMLSQFGSKQLETAVRLWSGRYDNAGRYASLLELSK